MREYKQILIPADEIKLIRGPSIILPHTIVASRPELMEKYGFETNDPKIGVRAFTIQRANGSRNVYIEAAPGITAIDCKWTQENSYPTGDPLEAFRYTKNDEDYYTTKNGASVKLSTFGLVIGIDPTEGRELGYTFTLLAEKRGRHQQQRGTISLPNQGYEVKWTRDGAPIDRIPITTDDFRKAIHYDSASTLLIDENHIIGYSDIGLGIMPGSIDAGGMVVVEIDHRELERDYKKSREEADEDPENTWKIPLIVRTRELKDFLYSHENVNSLLSEESLGQLFNDNDTFDRCYKNALKSNK